MAELIGSYADAGVDHLMVWLDPYTDEASSSLRRVSESFADNVVVYEWTVRTRLDTAANVRI